MKLESQSEEFKVESHYARILVLDKSEDLILHTRMFSSAHTALEIDSQLASTVQEAIEFLKREFFSLILFDITDRKDFGEPAFKKILQHSRDVPIVLVSSRSDAALALSMLSQGAQDFLIKEELTMSMLQRSIIYALQRHKMQREMQKLRIELESRSQHLQAMKSQLESFARMVINDFHVPLNAIANYTQQLELTGLNNLDNLGQLLVTNIKNSSSRLEKLLKHYREGIVGGSLFQLDGRTDVKLVIEEVLASMSLELSEREIVTFCWNLGRTSLSEDLVRSIFHKLIQLVLDDQHIMIEKGLEICGDEIISTQQRYVFKYNSNSLTVGRAEVMLENFAEFLSQFQLESEVRVNGSERICEFSLPLVNNV